MITIGLVADRFVESFEYTLQMIYSQTYKEIRLIISLDRYDANNIAEIIDAINIIGFEFENVVIRYNKERKGIKSNTEWIINNCNTDYCIILKNGDTFYEIDSLEKILAYAEERNAYRVNGQIVNISSEGEFISLTEEKIIFKPELYGKTENAQGETMQAPIVRRIVCSNDERFNTDIGHFFSESMELNKSDYKKFLELRYRDVKAIDEEITCICKNEAVSKYGMTYSKNTLVNVLGQIHADKEIHFNVRKRIKLLFLVMEFSTFPSVQKIYELSLRDDRFEADLVYVPFYHPNNIRSDEEEMKSYRDHGYNIIFYKDYNLQMSSPDVAFFIKSYDSVPKECYISEIYRVVDYSIFIRYCPDNIDAIDSIFFEKTAYRSSLNYLAWKNYVSSKKIFSNAQKRSWNHGENFFLEGSPRYDLDITSIEKGFVEEFREVTGRAKNRPIVLWNSSHQLVEGDHLGTFIKMGESMIQLFESFKNIFFIWRPHPLFWKALLKAYGEDKIDEIRTRINNCENIFLDSFESYLPSFCMCDALISDVSSLVGEYFVTLKPICLLVNEEAEKICPREYLESLYVARESVDVEEFLTNMTYSKDPLGEIRHGYVNTFFAVSDTKRCASQKILDDINDFFKG